MCSVSAIDGTLKEVTIHYCGVKLLTVVTPAVCPQHSAEIVAFNENILTVLLILILL